jgi:hypothetical protein
MEDSLSTLDKLEDVFGNAFGDEKLDCLVQMRTVEGTRGILHIFQNDVVNVGCSGVLVESPIGHPVTPVRGGIAIVHATNVGAILLDVSLHLAEAVEQGSPDPSLLVGESIIRKLTTVSDQIVHLPTRHTVSDHIADVVGGEDVGCGFCVVHAFIVPYI